MDAGWIDGYIAAWIPHPQAGGPGGEQLLAALVKFMADDVVYEDVPTSGVYRAHAGVAEMCRGAYAMSSDLTFEVVTRQCSGNQFAFESVGRGTNDGAVGPIPGTGRAFELRGVAIGSVDDAGKVLVHRDYWDLAGFLGQLGVV
jgi:steroid delta-isomerase-like uncharacterized protein